MFQPILFFWIAVDLMKSKFRFLSRFYKYSITSADFWLATLLTDSIFSVVDSAK